MSNEAIPIQWSTCAQSKESAYLSIVSKPISNRVRTSLLKAILTMPLKKMRMWPRRRPRRYDRSACLVDQTSYALRIIRLPRNQDVQIISEADETAIEHPMRRA